MKVDDSASEPESVNDSSEDEDVEESEVEQQNTSRKQSEPTTTSSLTALQLNNQIVKMRKPVMQARARLGLKLVRAMKKLQAKKTKNESQKAKNERKVQRLEEEVHAIKTIQRDEISKKALLNLSTLNDLVKPSTSAHDRAIAKLINEPVLVKHVDQFRALYTSWHREVPFLLQRLGQQYQVKKKLKDKQSTKTSEKTKTQDKKSSVAKQPDDLSENETTESEAEPKRIQAEPKQTETSPPKKQKAENKLSSKSKKVKKGNRSTNVKSATINTKHPEANHSQSVIRRFNLDELFAEGVDELKVDDKPIDNDDQTLDDTKKAKSSQRLDLTESSFFLPGPASEHIQREPLPDQNEQFAIDNAYNAGDETRSDRFDNKRGFGGRGRGRSAGQTRGGGRPNLSGQRHNQAFSKFEQKRDGFGKFEQNRGRGGKSFDHRSSNSDEFDRTKTRKTMGGSDRGGKSSGGKELHPSWVASRQQRDQREGARPMGKKIKFDDDD